MKKLDKERETSAVVVFRSFAIAGKPGRYMSIENGPKAVRLPSISILVKYLREVIVLFIHKTTGILSNDIKG